MRDDGKYCSVWPPSRVESCYTVSFMDDVLFWHSGRKRYPSAIQVLEKDTGDVASDTDDSEMDDVHTDETSEAESKTD